MIQSLDLDLIGICETFLRGKDELHLDGYTWLGNNRKELSKRAIRGSGGVGLFIRDSLLLNYCVSVIDSKTEGILWALLLNRYDNQSITVCICYLPPSNSSRGDISLEFFNTLRYQVSKYHDTGVVCICGDFNARVGSLIRYRS